MKPLKSARLRHFLVSFGLMASVAVLLLLFARPRSASDKAGSADALPRVSAMVIKPNTRSIELVLPSSAEAWHVTPIWARANGYVVRFVVDIGDAVKTGDLLAELDTPEADAAVEQAKADLQNAIAERDIAKLTSERWQRLSDKNREAVSQQEVDQYSGNYRAAEAVVKARQENVARLVYQQQFKYLYAPFDGIIAKRSIDIGTLVYGTINGTQQELFQIAQAGTMRFFVDVPQTYFRQIKEGIEAEITIPQLPDRNFKGHVVRFAKALDPLARTLLTQIDVDNSDGWLYPGLYGRAKFTMQPDAASVIIPTAAIIIRAGFPHVAVLDAANTVQLKQIVIGLDYGKEIEVTSGLSAGERIITQPTAQIYAGTKVAIYES